MLIRHFDYVMKSKIAYFSLSVPEFCCFMEIKLAEWGLKCDKFCLIRGAAALTSPMPPTSMRMSIMVGIISVSTNFNISNLSLHDTELL